MLKVPLYEFQNRASHFGRTRKSFALFMQQGTGKTFVALDVVGHKFEVGDARNLMIVALKSGVPGWRMHIRRLMPMRCEIYSMQQLKSSDKVREKFLRRRPDRLTILDTNYEQVVHNLDLLLELPWDMAIADESQRMKHRTSLTSKSMHKLADHIPRRAILTGTPVSGNEVHVWSQFRFMNKKVFGEWKDFEKKFLRKAGYMGYERKIRSHKRKEFEKLVHAHSFMITKAEALDLPPEVDQYLYCELTGEAARHYDNIEEDMMTMIEDEGLITTTDMVVTQMLRLQQLTGGWLKTDDGQLKKVGNHKINVLAEFLNDWKEKLVIFVRFIPELQDIMELCKRYNISAVPYYGKTKDRGVWREFQDKKNPRVFVAQISTGSASIDLYRAHTSIFYSRSFKWDDYDQAKARLHRNGQEHKVTHLHIEAENTIDTYLTKVLKRRGNVSKRLFDTYRKEGRPCRKLPQRRQ